MNRIYTAFIGNDKKIFQDGRLLLAYFLIRSKSRKSAGYFNQETFNQTVQLKARAGKAMLARLVAAGFVSDQKKGSYRVVGQKKLFISSRRNLCYCISDKQLRRFTLKRISYFRAFLSELEAERYKIHQKAVIKGYTRISRRDGSIEKIKDQTNTKYDQLMALTCMAALIGKSKSTAGNFRNKQFLVRYDWELEIIKQDDRRINQKGAWTEFECETGKGFSKGSLVVYSPISRRTVLSDSGILLKRR